jgi:hypothetical protein
VDLVDVDVEGPPLRPSREHPQEHVGPILRFGPAGAGLDRRDRVVAVVRASEQCLKAQGAE